MFRFWVDVQTNSIEITSNIILNISIDFTIIYIHSNQFIAVLRIPVRFKIYFKVYLTKILQSKVLTENGMYS